MARQRYRAAQVSGRLQHVRGERSWQVARLGYALDFFSGETMPVKADLLDNGDQDRSFTDAKGGFHIGEDKGFDFQWRGGLASGVDLAAETLSLKGTDYQCFTGLGGVSGGGKDNSGHSKWTKIPIYHINPRPGACPSGSYASGIDSALDLDDGTFLVTMGCWVFRLRKSDLSPMGSAPGLRVVDATDVQATIDRAKGKNIQDAASYLAKALHLDFDVANSCGAEAAH
jgi:hypothetical protein